MPQLKDGTVIPAQVEMKPDEIPNSFPAKSLSFCWRCTNGHIIGVVIREPLPHRSGTIPRLMLFRGALDPEEMASNAIPFAKIDSGEVVCGLCGDRKTWYPADDFIDNLMKSKKDKNK